VSERMSGGSGGREEEMNGQRLMKFGCAAMARGTIAVKTSRRKNQGGQAPVKAR